MALREEFESAGNWLFRRRGSLPALLFIPLFLGMWHHNWPMHNYRAQQVWEVSCLAVSLVGLCIRAIANGYAAPNTSGGNTKCQIADSVNMTGIYSVVRHPLYLGSFFMWLGIAMLSFDWRLIAIFVLVFFLYYERIMYAEEEFLRRKFGKEYEEWAEKTPAFIPRLRNWRPCSRSFCLQNVLRREYSGILALGVSFFTVIAAEHWLVERRVWIEPYWFAFLAVCVLLFVTLRTLKKCTMVLQVEGR